MPLAADLSHVRSLRASAENLLNQVAKQADAEARDHLSVRFNVKQAAELVGRSESTIRAAENSGELPSPKKSEAGMRIGYELADLNVMRDHFGTRPYRQEHEEPVILSFQNFKGGVGKSTTAVHAAQYFAIKGYRTLLVDIDPQSSATLLFGINPNMHVDVEATVLPYLMDQSEDLTYAVRGTYWEGLDLIPSNLGVYEAEYIIAGGGGDPNRRFEKLRTGLQVIAAHYDIVILDPPPALGMISLNALRAANAIVIPTPPAVVDYGSTVMFLSMLEEALTVMQERGFPAEYHFLKLLATKVDEQKLAEQIIRKGMDRAFGRDIFPNALVASAEYNSGAAGMRSIYEKTSGFDKTYRRARANLDFVMAEIEAEVQAIWPSHQKAMKRRGAA
ncbi:MAG: AAA family ATPase [Pseudomonadota bacterium]